MLGGAGGAGCSSPDSAGREEVAEMVEEPLESGRGGELGEVRIAVPLIGVTASLSGLFLRMEGRGEPGTVLSDSEGIMGVILAGVMVAGWLAWPELSWPSPAGKVVMVTLFSLSLSYISVVWLKLGMAMAGTLALVMVRLTGLATT